MSKGVALSFTRVAFTGLAPADPGSGANLDPSFSASSVLNLTSLLWAFSFSR